MLTLEFSPFPVLTSERLMLRSITLEDAKEIFLLRSDERVMQYIDREPFKNIEETNSFIEKILDSLHKNDAILWVITLKENPRKLIGTTGFWNIVKEHYRAEIGYMLNSDYWRKGIMKEAVKCTIEFAFTKTDIHSIEANINPENTASLLLLKSCGFVQEAYFKENYYFNGVFKDSIIYSLVKKNENLSKHNN